MSDQHRPGDFVTNTIKVEVPTGAPAENWFVGILFDNMGRIVSVVKDAEKLIPLENPHPGMIFGNICPSGKKHVVLADVHYCI
jgi:hypothetical protein